MMQKTTRVRLTTGRVQSFECPPGKSQAFLWDTDTPSLALRVTPTGRKTYVFEARLNGDTIRLTIGTAADWPIEKARSEAQRLKMLVDQGTDPREVERQEAADRASLAVEQAAEALTVGEVWARYIAERRPKWGERNYADHAGMTEEGGQKRRRGEGTTKAGPLASLMAMRLVDLDGPAVETWAAKEAKDRPARVRLALRLLKAFLRWAAAEPDLKGKVDATAASAKKAREAAGRPALKDDVLERGQLAAWFDQVRQLHNPVIAAYLQTLLLTGARPGEVLAMRWTDLNTQWNSITIRDKVEGERQIPLTPYVARLLDALPRRNEWVYSGGRALLMTEANIARRKRQRIAKGAEFPEVEMPPTSTSGRLVEPSISHRKACATAGLDGLTLHGLRRSFASLTEWLEIPAGVVAQIQGHKPSATAEKHYRRRPLDLLRVHHERIEAWVLEQAGIGMDPTDDEPTEVVT